jgi:hypothetical protein
MCSALVIFHPQRFLQFPKPWQNIHALARYSPLGVSQPQPGLHIGFYVQIILHSSIFMKRWVIIAVEWM